jgi:SAM-dependent methyltransferase
MWRQGSRSAVNRLRALVYPGFDLHTRSRAALCTFWKSGPRDVLDAGSGNGYFAWLAYESGARVVGMSFDCRQVEKAQEFLLAHKGADPARLRFEQCNLYDLTTEKRTFDEIICYEVLEHIRRDRDVVTQFHRILRQGGTLHLCCPNRLHPRHQAEVIDPNESGGHVRAGYTEEDYRALLEPAGFCIDRIVGVGSHSVYIADKILRVIRSQLGDLPVLPLLPLALPLVRLAQLDPAVPFSLYARAVKVR